MYILYLHNGLSQSNRPPLGCDRNLQKLLDIGIYICILILYEINYMFEPIKYICLFLYVEFVLHDELHIP